ncbi:MAG: hypothetical protein EKK34_31270 [Mycobacterium sp.]|nr:MAG: hypothetical protein EKK34_31270 [Mycobacterium sp.]
MRRHMRYRPRLFLGLAAVFTFAAAPIIVNVISNHLDQVLPKWLVGRVTWPLLLLLAVIVGLASWGASYALRKPSARAPTRHRSLIAAIDSVNPLDVGVAPATQNVIAGGRLPTYQPRDVDSKLDEAVSAAVSGRGNWIVVVEGDTAVGKTRTLFEALSRYGASVDSSTPVRRLTMIAADSRENLWELLGTERLDVNGPAVLWLDDLEDFLPHMTFGDLREWQKAGDSRIVAATHGGKAGPERISSIASDIRQYARVIRMVPTIEAEIEALRDTIPELEWQEMASKGLAEYFVGVEPLKSKLSTAHHLGEKSKCREGQAVVYAAIDWRRCGRTDPIPKKQLRKLFLAYLPSGVPNKKATFRTALRWATRPLTSHCVLLKGDAHAGYQAADTLIEERLTVAPTEAAWATALRTLPSNDAGLSLAVGFAAAQHERWTDAIDAFDTAGLSTRDEVAATAKINLACAQRKAERLDDALRTTQDAAFERWGASANPIVRERAAEALYQQTLVLLEFKDFSAAVNSLDRIINTYGRDDDDSVRARAAHALGVHSILTEIRTSGRAGLREASQAVVDRYGDDPAWQVREQVADIMVNSAIESSRDSGASIAIAAFYGEIIARFGKDIHPALRYQVAVALVNRGAEFIGLKQPEEAAADFERVVRDYAEGTELTIRQQVLKATLNRAIIRMDQEGMPQEALSEFLRIIAQYSSDRSPVMREGVARAMVRKGIALSAIRGRQEDALRTFQLVVERYEGKNTPNYRRIVAQARSEMLKLLTPPEALKVYKLIDERYHNDTDPLIREIVARTLNERGKSRLNCDSQSPFASHARVVQLYGRDPIIERSQLGGPPAKMGVQVAEALCAMGDILADGADVAERKSHLPSGDQRVEASNNYYRAVLAAYANVKDDDLQGWVAYATNCLSGPPLTGDETL